MAITFDSAISGFQDDETSLTVEHVLGSGSSNDRIVVAFVHFLDSDGTDSQLDTLTYDGTAMTYISDEVVSPAWYGRSYLYYILDTDLPATSGTYDVVATGAQYEIAGQAMTVMSIEGAKQQAPEAESSNSTSTAGTSISTAATSVTNNAWYTTFASGMDDADSATFTWGTGQTERRDAQHGTYHNVGASTEEKASAGSDTQSATFSTEQNWSFINTAVWEPAAGGGDPDPAPSVVDTITVAENVSLLLDKLFPSVNDSITTAESANLLIDKLFPSVSDSVTVAENANLVLDKLFPSVVDSVSVADVVANILIVLGISVSDSVSINDVVVNLFLDELFINTVDSIVANDVVVKIEFNPLVVEANDSISINDVTSVVNTDVGLNLLAFDTVSISDVPNIERGRTYIVKENGKLVIYVVGKEIINYG